MPVSNIYATLRVIAAGAAIFASGAVWAGEWTLPATLKEAALNHPSVKLRQSELRAARFEFEGASWARYPSLGTELIAEQGGPQAVLRLQQPVWSGGRIAAQIAQTGSSVSAKEAAVQEAQLSIMLDAGNAYFESLRLQARLEAAQANEEEHRRLVDIIERRVNAKVSPKTDATQANARLQQAISERLLFERQIDGLRVTLEQLVGRSVTSLKEPVALQLDGQSLDGLKEAALRYSPSRKRLSAEVEVGEAQVLVARSQLMPQVSVSYERKLGELSNGSDRSRIFLGMTVQTGAGLSSLSGIEAAVARAQSSRDGLDQNLRQLDQTILSTWKEGLALEAQLQPARALLSASDDVVESYLRQFQVGRKSWLDVLNAQREKTNARYSLADTEVPLQLGRLRLLLLAGLVLPDSMSAISP